MCIIVFRQNQTQEQKKAEAERKSSKRASEKEERRLKRLKLDLTNQEWILGMLTELSLDVVTKSEQMKTRRQKNKERMRNLRSKESLPPSKDSSSLQESENNSTNVKR